MFEQQSMTATTDTTPVLPPPVPASAAPRLEFIDGLRGVAMLMVLLFHSYVFGGAWRIIVPIHGHPLNLCSIFGIGSIGVSLFLILSGFCLYWPFARADSDPDNRRPDPTLKTFAYRRCRRILPPYYVALILFIALQIVQQHIVGTSSVVPEASVGEPTAVPWKSFLLHLLMLQNLRPQYFYDINGSFWSLALEFHLYVLFPIFVILFRRLPQRATLIALFLATTAFRLIALKSGGMSANEWVNVLTYSVFGRCFEFALGMYAAVKVARASRASWNAVSLLSKQDIGLAAVLFLAAMIGYKRGYFEVFKAAATGLVFVGLLLAAARPRSILHRALSSKVLVTLGTISYSIYLIHHPIVTMMGAFAASHGFTNSENIVFMWFFVMPLILILGSIYYRYFERPFVGAPGRAANAVRTKPLPAN